MDQKAKDDSDGEFQEFGEQYMLCSRANPLSPRQKSPNRVKLPYETERSKIKVIATHQKNNLTEIFFNSVKGHRNTHDRSQIINIGDVIFRSNFESGNLQSVTKIAPKTYQVTLNTETNSSRTSAWFYFIVQGLKGDINFIVKGFSKSRSLYNSGMRICYRQISEGSTWKRGGNKIQYLQTESENQEQNQYQLQFTFNFKNPQIGIEFAYCFPYSFTNLLNFITLNKIKYESLGKTYEGRQIPLLTIGNPKSKKVIILSARAHPGETVGSWMMQGFLKQLLSQNKYSNSLRDAFLFKIIPMINIDGVVNGNYRFSGAGFDLNRKWKRPSDKIHPQVYLLKQYIKNTHKEKDVIMYIDFHGHSRQKNVFFYGCCPKQSSENDGCISTKPKQFPFLMSKIQPAFRFDYCSYAIQKEKEGTARISMWNQLKIDYVYTMEASFCSSQGGGNYSISDYQKIGGKLCKGICLHFWKLIKQLTPTITLSSNNKPQQSTNLQSLKIQEELNKNMNQFFENPSLAAMQFANNSSDSEPEAGEIPMEQRKNIKNLNPYPQKNGKNNFGNKMKKQEKFLSAYQINDFQKFQSKEERIMSHKTSGQSQNRRNKTNQSIKLTKKGEKQQQYEILEENQLQNFSLRKAKKNYYIQADILNKDIEDKIKLISKVDKRRGFETQRESTNIFEIEKQDPNMIYKKKILSLGGAQYRRAMKFAEEKNKNRTQVFSHQSERGEQLIQSLMGMSNLIEIQKLQPKARAPKFFPATRGSMRNRNATPEVYFKRTLKNFHPKPQQHKQKINFDVKCQGKQIL